MPTTVYLISGANRGIGLGFVSAYLKRENVVIFAGARDPSKADKLHALSKEFPEKLHLVKVVSGDEVGNKAIVEEIKSKAGRLDVVIANAGINRYFSSAIEMPAKAMSEHFEVNVIGTLTLFQATYPLLKASTPTPKFVYISSGGGSVTMGPQFPAVLAYGASKAAANYLVRKLHFENEGLIAFPICPGAVHADMSAYAVSQVPAFKGTSAASVEDSVNGMLPIIDNATRPTDSNGPVFHRSGGETWPWIGTGISVPAL